MLFSSRVENRLSGFLATALCFALVLLGIVVSAASTAYAQGNEFSLTVTPPLFQLSLEPGEVWRSTVRVVNTNPYDLIVSTEPVNFQSDGEEGKGKFVPLLGQNPQEQQTTLAGWMTVPDEPLLIEREQTAEVPLTVTVPEDAPPGGHYAAVLIGNSNVNRDQENGSVSVTGSIAALVFLNIAGDVVEKGRIRDFYAEKSFYQEPEVRMSLRFENQGNVHILPRGDVTIYNMWGKKRGYVAVNQKTDFGNVLPGSVRRFAFTWKGDMGLYDIGRYRAEATLGYGATATTYASATTHFWVVPLVPAAKVVGGTLAVLLFFVWSVRAYVRRALSLETARLLSRNQKHVLENVEAQPEEPHTSLRTLVRPIEAGIVDLRSATQSSTATTGQGATPIERPHRRALFKKYRFFLLFLVLVALVYVALSTYFDDVLTYEREYEVLYEE